MVSEHKEGWGILPRRVRLIKSFSKASENVRAGQQARSRATLSVVPPRGVANGARS